MNLNVSPMQNTPQMPFIRIDISGGQINHNKIHACLLEWVWGKDKKQNKKMSKNGWKKFSKDNSLSLNDTHLPCDAYCTNRYRWAFTHSEGNRHIKIYLGLCKTDTKLPTKLDIIKSAHYTVEKIPKEANLLQDLLGKIVSEIKVWDNRNSESGIELQKPSFSFLGSFIQPDVLTSLGSILLLLVKDSFQTTEWKIIFESLIKNLPIAIFFFILFGIIKYMTSRTKTYWVVKT